MRIGTGLWLPRAIGMARASAIFGAGDGGGAPSAPPGSPLLWYKHDGDLWSDAGSTPIADGEGVYQIDDEGSTGLDPQQSNASDRPVYRADYASSGYGGVEFHEASGNDYWTKAGEPDLSGPITCFASIYADTPYAGGEIINVFNGGSGSANAWRFAVGANAKLVASRPYSTDIETTAAVTLNAWNVVGARVKAAGAGDTDFYLNEGVTENKTMNDNGSHTTGDLWIGRFSSSGFSDNFEGAIGEIVVYDSALSDEDTALLLAYLRGRVGLS